MSAILFTNISELITNRGVAKKGGVGITHDDLGIIRNGALLWDTKKGILWLGENENTPKSLTKKCHKVSLKGKILTPSLVDCHTHFVFAGSRHNEFLKRLSGFTYQEIAEEGGGINTTVKATRAATEKELYTNAKSKIEELSKYGVGIVEIKSGYGLNWKTEEKCLKVIKKIKKEFSKSLIVKSTFLGAHAFPPEATNSREKVNYAIEVAEKMLPLVKKQSLADAVDVFFDQGYFTKSQSSRILSHANRLGFDIKLHADELADTGGATLAAELGALSADHLLKANELGLQKMGKRGVVAVLLPGTAFYLGLPYADIEKMRRSQVCMALASDYNPGSCPTYNLPFIMSLACLQMGMTPAEAFAATTYGGAKALNLHDSQGFLKIGMKPKISIFNIQSYACLIQNIAHSGLCSQVL